MRSPVAAQAEPALVSERHERVMGLIRYLLRVTSLGAISPTVAMHAWSVWEWLDAAVGHRLAVPDAGPGPAGQLLYVWEKDDHYLDVEVFPEGQVEIFYRNEATGQLWDSQMDVGETIPEEALERLALFAADGEQ